MKLEDPRCSGRGVTYRNQTAQHLAIHGHTEEAQEYELGRHRLARVWSTLDVIPVQGIKAIARILGLYLLVGASHLQLN